MENHKQQLIFGRQPALNNGASDRCGDRVLHGGGTRCGFTKGERTATLHCLLLFQGDPTSPAPTTSACLPFMENKGKERK